MNPWRNSRGEGDGRLAEAWDQGYKAALRALTVWARTSPDELSPAERYVVDWAVDAVKKEAGHE